MSWNNIFDELARNKIEIERIFSERAGRYTTSGIFLPHMGNALQSGGGIYYIGQATHGWPEPAEQSAQACQAVTRAFLDSDSAMLDGGTLSTQWHTPFWRFLNLLCERILGARMLDCRERWGWSNILKIGASPDDPPKWGQEMVNVQRASCIASLEYEFDQLRNTCIYIASSSNDFGVVRKVRENEKLRHDSPAHKALGLQSYHGPNGNVIFYGPHPGWPPFDFDQTAEAVSSVFLASRSKP
jgi:hypothetical protein